MRRRRATGPAPSLVRRTFFCQHRTVSSVPTVALHPSFFTLLPVFLCPVPFPFSYCTFSFSLFSPFFKAHKESAVFFWIVFRCRAVHNVVCCRRTTPSILWLTLSHPITVSSPPLLFPLFTFPSFFSVSFEHSASFWVVTYNGLYYRLSILQELFFSRLVFLASLPATRATALLPYIHFSLHPAHSFP